MLKVLLVLFFALAVISGQDDSESLESILNFLHPITFSKHSKVISEKCLHQGIAYENGLKNFEIWAFKMYDAGGKIQSSLLNGNDRIYGDFTQCLAVSNENGLVKGKYCSSRIHVEAKEKKIAKLFNLIQSYHAVTSAFNDKNTIVPYLNSIIWDFCMPSACDGNDLENILQEVLAPYNKTDFMHTRVKATCHNTLLDVPHDFPLIIGFLTLLAILVFFGTINDAYAGKSIILRVARAFSLKTNFRLLMERSPKNQISCLHGLRAIFAVNLYVQHIYFFQFNGPVANRTEISIKVQGPISMLARAIYNSLDPFVLMSGFLMAFSGVKKLQSSSKLDVASTILKRYLRYVPIVILASVVLRNASHLWPGPSMMQIGMVHVENCRERFWENVLLISNIHSLKDICYPPIHQLVIDMQLLLVTPFLVWLMLKHPGLGRKTFIGASAFAILYKAYSFSTNELTAIFFHGITAQFTMKSSDQLYLNPLHRLIPHLIGVGMGFYISATKQIKKLTKIPLCFGWLLSATCYIILIFSMVSSSYPGYEYHHFSQSVFGLAQPFLSAFPLAWIIYTCSTGQANGLDGILSWSWLSVFTKLSLPFCFFQLLILMLQVAVTNTPQYVSVFTVLDLNVLAILLSVSVASLMLLMIPLARLWYDLFGTKVAKD